ncbi:MAG: hypothetical protein QXU89_02245 [Desulfurococcaceae archaeon]
MRLIEIIEIKLYLDGTPSNCDNLYKRRAWITSNIATSSEKIV